MKTVLIVDDSALMRRLIRNAVLNYGYTVVGEATDGAMGVEKYKELRPDIVTLDLIMKGMNGLDALRLIFEENPDANVIMISSIGQDVFVRDAITLGAKHYVLKPFGEQDMAKAFEKIG
jgi:two-component system chemotaxis response regulator CheY